MSNNATCLRHSAGLAPASLAVYIGVKLKDEKLAKDKEFSKFEAVKRYLPLMHEFVIRVDLVAHACNGKLNLTPPYAREYAYLQFRRMCELIALGSLLIHGDLSKAQAAKKEWNAEKIMKLLHNEHPNSFPQSVTINEISGGCEIIGNSVPNALSREEFKNLYCECGEVLHRGTIKTLESSSALTKEKYKSIIEWQNKIVALMNQHLIARKSGKEMHIISLKASSGYPECVTYSLNSKGKLELVETVIDKNSVQ